jgi:hypothetical protein
LQVIGKVTLTWDAALVASQKSFWATTSDIDRNTATKI